jgi:hypothetical protein
MLEARRPAGPIPFEEIQNKIAEALLQLNTEKAIDGFLADVRKRVPVKSRFLDQSAK